MIKTKHITSILFAIILIPLSVRSAAQIVDVSDCRAIEDRLKRFDCYETLGTDEGATEASANRQGASSTNSPAQPGLAKTAPADSRPVERAQQAPAQNPESAVNEDIAKFGTNAAAESARLTEGKGGETELVDTVASVEQRLPTLVLVTLSNGQKWLQSINKRYPLKAGDEVRIYPSGFGKAYRLTAPRISGFIQVERIQ